MKKSGTAANRTQRFLFIIITGLALGSCQPKKVAFPAHQADTVKQESQALLVLSKVRGLLAGSDFESHVLTIGGKMTLAVWYVVNPKDAWLVREQERFPCPAWPEQAALLMMNMILSKVPETLDCIEIFNPMLVTKDHVCIMLDMIDITGAPKEGFLDYKALVEYLRNTESKNYFLL